MVQKDNGEVVLVFQDGWTWRENAFSTFKYQDPTSHTSYFCSEIYCAAYSDIAELSYRSYGADLGDFLSGGGLTAGILIIGLPVVAISELGDLVDSDHPGDGGGATENVDVAPVIETAAQRELRRGYETGLNAACEGSEHAPDASIRSTEARRQFVFEHARQLSGHCLSFLIQTRWGFPETFVSTQDHVRQMQVYHGLKALGSVRLAWEVAHCDGVFLANYNPIRELPTGETPFRYSAIEFSEYTISQIISVLNDTDLFSYRFDFEQFCRSRELNLAPTEALESRQLAVLELFSPFRRFSSLRLNGYDIELAGLRGRMFSPGRY
tara:strand:+ start:8954 stop:9925 length:972 start_codon:yes stop_codon:yes gene_type:complete